MNVIVGKAGNIPKNVLFRMFEMRHNVFKTRMKWDVSEPLPGIECDEFDNFDPLYGVCIEYVQGKGNIVLGCWRLLPTTGPYMLRDVFPFLLHGQAPDENPGVWEISRFAVTNEDARGKVSDSTVNEATRMLLSELFRLGATSGIRRFVACSDVRFQRILRLIGVNVGTYGPSMRIGNTTAVGGWADVAGHHDLLAPTIPVREAA